MNRCEVLHGDCLEKLKELDDCSVDAVVTDPPYELGFMGKTWDAAGIAYDVGLWREALRVLKPGGHLLAFGGTRTYHRMTCAIEDAGFEIRDSIHWMYGSGFPKSLDVSKALDKMMGAEREVLGVSPNWRDSKRDREEFGSMEVRGENAGLMTAPATDAARQWEGFGTALKPSHEPIVVARKPLDGTVAANVLAHGVGGINIDGCRIATSDDLSKINRIGDNGWKNSSGGPNTAAIRKSKGLEPLGRWPPNVIFSHLPECGDVCVAGCAVKELNAQSGVTVSRRYSGRNGKDALASTFGLRRLVDTVRGHDDSGGASRFFPAFRYQAKPSRRERDAGLEGFDLHAQYKAGGVGGTGGKRSVEAALNARPAANTHPTVKPVDLMRWLVRLVTPPGGLVLDPFTGSGTTGVAALLEGFRFIGCEREAEYLAIAKARLEAAASTATEKQPTLFDLEAP